MCFREVTANGDENFAHNKKIEFCKTSPD
jgi:hypothetical protein